MKKQTKKQASKRGSYLVANNILASQLSVYEGCTAKKAKSSSGYASMNASLSVALSVLTTPASTRQVQCHLDVVSAFSNTSIVASISADLDSAIANMAYCKALPFSFGECPHFQRVLHKEVEANASYENDEDGADESSDESDDGADTTAEEDELNVYMLDDEWDTFITGKSKGIFKPIMDAIAKRSPGILHYSYTSYICSVYPDIVQDAKRRLKGNGDVCNEIKNCVRRLLCHGLDGSVNGTLDVKADQFWDKLKHFQNRKDACWGDEDEQLELGLLKWGVDVEELKKPVGPQRLFKCWIKDWENVMDNGQ
eukprot:CCRYP_001490-RA/>CCRYP_001490-RA protein AED:0.45 eAED:0.45 QI:0/0/0/0.66/0.5/0.33/3/0/310